MAPGDRGEQFRVESGAGKHPYFTKKIFGIRPFLIVFHWTYSSLCKTSLEQELEFQCFRFGIAFFSVRSKQYSFSYQPCSPTTMYCNLQSPSLLPKAGSALNSDQVALDFVWLVENLRGRRCRKQLPG